MIKLIIDGIDKEFSDKVTYEEVVDKYQRKDKPLIVAVKADNKLMELSETAENGKKIDFIDLTYTDGVKIYQRSLSFIFIKAMKELFEDTEVIIKHSLSKGLYCEFEGEHIINNKDIPIITEKMNQIIKKNEKFKKELISVGKAVDIFTEKGMKSKVDLLKYRCGETVKIYSLGELKDYFYGYMVPSTSYVKKFELFLYSPGIILRHPIQSCPLDIPEFEEQRKIFEIHNEAEKWGEILNIGYVANLNEKIENGEIDEFIRISEALHEKKIAQIADLIANENKRIILIAGPSSSGKTTFANRLKIQLRVNGLKPLTFSTDDYFVDREFTPLDENGEFDFDSIKAVDVELFNKDLKNLINGEEVDLPSFNFKIGKKEYGNKKIKIDEDQLIIIEGIHGLNELLTKDILKKDKYKIYISALTQLNIDSHNRIPTTDTRIVRRVVRDNYFRGHNALKTLQMWKSVREGEEKNIFPYQEDADVMFNSALFYELAVLKKYALPLLSEIDQSSKEYSEARRLIKFLKYFKTIENEDSIPNTSILKEFIGGSSFTI